MTQLKSARICGHFCVNGCLWGVVGRADNIHLHFHTRTHVVPRCCTFSCTSTHTSRYAPVRSLALPHRCHATLLYVLLHFHTDVTLRSCTFSRTSAQTSCYCAFPCTSTHTRPDTLRSLALPHTLLPRRFTRAEDSN